MKILIGFFLFTISFTPSIIFAKENRFNPKILKTCRAHIKEALCLVDPVDYNNPFATPYNRPCLDGGAKYAAVFQKHFDQANPMIQRMYCSLEKIWIENTLTTTAYATPIYDMSDTLVSAGIGIKKDFIEQSLKMDQWLSLKEESSFGGKPGLIKYTTVQTDKKLTAITYAINHEFGHIFDYANKLNRYENHKPLPGSWAEISWQDDETPLAENNMSLRSGLCFYICRDEYMNANQSAQLFNELTQTSFQSTYATVNPKEDWAEAFALTLATKEVGFQWQAETQGKKFNLTEHFYSEKLKKKRDFVAAFLKSDYIYPGEVADLEKAD